MLAQWAVVTSGTGGKLNSLNESAADIGRHLDEAIALAACY